MDLTLEERSVEDTRPDMHVTVLVDKGESDETVAARTPLGESGSIVLIDSMTNGIIGTLTPASPETIGRSPSSLSDKQANETDIEATLTPFDGSGTGDKQDRRDSTYTYRLSKSDVSLRTYKPDSRTDEGLPVVSAAGSPVHTQNNMETDDRRGRTRRSWMTDDASFWTARGTLRMDEGGREGREREVMVAFVKADKDVSPDSSA